jgi:homoserine O-succinyltransferase
MPVYVDTIDREHCLYPEAMPPAALPRDCLTIGLVNNMADGALASTEGQVFDLLRAAGDDLPIRLSFYALPGVVRSQEAQDYVRRSYLGVDTIYRRTLDGLIVTGAEPRAAQLTDEAYWGDLQELIEWAKVGVGSAIWSCLAVHAAVQHLDGIERRPLAKKCFGIFEQTRASVDHPLLTAAPERLLTPHSRWNDIPEEALRSSGYDVLTRSSESGVDTFVRRYNRSLFVFLQGHPEYTALSLLGEYRRDVGRFLRGESDSYPTLPANYFNESTEKALVEFQDRAIRKRCADLMSSFPLSRAAESVENTWRIGAVQFYRNWLKYLWATRSSARRRAGEANLMTALSNG